jgi:hypothetical protein
MSIRDRQIDMASQEVLNQELKAGRYPDLTTVQQKVVELFQERPAGLARFILLPAVPDALSNPDEYNLMMNNISKDLQTAFLEIGYQADRILANTNIYETEKHTIGLLIRKIDNRIQSLMDKIAQRGHREVIFNTLNTFNNIDFKGNETRGIPKTDVFVDLQNGQALLDVINTGGTKYDISNATYTVSLTKGSGIGTENLPLNNALKDTINEIWQYTVVSNKTESSEVTIVLTLTDVVPVTGMSINFNSPKETNVKVLVSKDQELYTELSIYSSYDHVEWQLDSDVKYIKIILTKAEPDTVDGTDLEYNFGISNISLKKEIHQTLGYLISQPHLIRNKIANEITLQTQEIIPPQTSIRYYIGIDNPGDIIEWQEIEIGIPYQLNQLLHKSININHTSSGYGILVKQHFSVDYFSLLNLIDVPEQSTTKIYTGDYMWKVDTKVLTLDPLYIPTLKDWINPRGTVTKFLPVEQTILTNSFDLTVSSLQRLTTNIFCTSPTIITNNELTIDADAVIAQVYINNTLIKPVIDSDGKYRYNYTFKAGWNNIQILTHTIDTATIKVNLVLTDIATKVYANPEPLKELSLYNLLNNTSKTDLQNFCIDDGKILINYSPTDSDIFGVGVRYAVEYDYGRPEATNEMDLRFMAILSRTDLSDKVTPILQNYQLIIE